MDRPSRAESPLADAYIAATSALQTLSAISQLARSQQEHPVVEAIVEKLLAQIDGTHDVFAPHPSDAVVDALRGFIGNIAARVQGEFNGAQSCPNYAGQVARGLLEGGGVPEFDEASLGQLVAIEWDIDPHAAVQWLERRSDI